MISTLTGSSSSKIKSKWSSTIPCVTGYDVFADSAYSVTYGKVVYVGQETDGTFTINVKCNDNEILRYSNLKGTYVLSSTDVRPGTKLGDAIKYVHFEYLTRWQDSSNFPVRINQYLYFKQDPGDIVEGKYLPTTDSAVEYAPSRNITQVTYSSDAQQYEFQRN